MANKSMWATLAAVAAVGGGIGVSMATSGSHSATTGTDAMPGMTHGTGTTTTGTGGSSAAAATLSDDKFISMMIPHHESAIVMAKLALKRADHKQVGVLAQGIMSAQASEVTKMRGWYRKWFGRDVPAMSTSAAGMAGMGMGSDMASLATAKSFDKAFLSMMIPHHAGAIVMANQVLSSKRPEIRKLGAEIIAAQAKEIGQMQNWRVAWYPPLG